MDQGRFLVEAHLREGRPVAELASAHGVSRSWLYKLLARYREHGWAGLEARSRRPKHSPTRIADHFEDEIVALRKDLAENGFDAGAVTIQHHLTQRHDPAPSVSTVWRVLQSRGFVVPQPHKRPRSSYVRFEADLPNECWQLDVTHVWLADGDYVEILNIIDDHSRLCIATRPLAVYTAADIVAVFRDAADHWGLPASVLTDNGAIFTAAYRGGIGAFESELADLGIACKHSRPYHPQTCGKVERFHQTMKRYLAKQRPARNTRTLQTQLGRFVDYYNNLRPHRSLNRRTPAEVFTARTKAHPNPPPDAIDGYRLRHDTVDTDGKLTVRHAGRLHHIGMGRRHAGKNIAMLIAGRHIRVLNDDTGELLRELTLDPTRDYQPQQ